MAFIARPVYDSVAGKLWIYIQWKKMAEQFMEQLECLLLQDSVIEEASTST